MGKRKDLTYWNIPVTRTLDEAVEKAVKADMHVSKSDLVRDAVRRLLGMQLEETAEAKK
jgi:Arc/MetJ-type ribon-helix-helix transcriptional regulator